MKKKSILKVIIDILMLILMLLEYSKIYTGQLMHEIIGIVLFGLFIIHNILNIKFYKNLFKGKYNSIRIITTIVNIAFLICMILTIALGIPISSELFKGLGLNGSMTTRKLHTIFGYWGLVILSIHLGMHFKMIFAKVNNKLKNKNIAKIVIYLIELLIIILGIKVMVERNFGDYLIGKASFAIPSGNILTEFLNNFIIVLSIGFITYNLEKILRREKSGKSRV